jgi:hypothetical protein
MSTLALSNYESIARIVLSLLKQAECSKSAKHFASLIESSILCRNLIA